MPALVDVNVLLPLCVAGHPHGRAAYAWWNARDRASVSLCLPIRMAMLRLLTNRAVMGSGVLPPEEAWRIWREFELDERTTSHYDMPAGVDAVWFANVRGRTPSPKLWTDAWLAAFASVMGWEMVTFDRDFRRFRPLALTLLHA